MRNHKFLADDDRKEARYLRHVSDALELPKDLLLGDAMITMTGYREMYIENFQGIIEYQRDYIRIRGKNCRIRIEGERLDVCHYTNDEIKIQGKITQIIFEN